MAPIPEAFGVGATVLEEDDIRLESDGDSAKFAL